MIKKNLSIKNTEDINLKINIENVAINAKTLEFN